MKYIAKKLSYLQYIMKHDKKIYVSRYDEYIKYKPTSVGSLMTKKHCKK